MNNVIIKTKGDIFLKYGVWGDYERVTKDAANSALERSSHPPITKYDNDGNLYITIPKHSDMW